MSKSRKRTLRRQMIRASGEQEQQKAFSLEATAEVEFQAAAEANGQEPKRPTFSIKAYNGGTLRVAGYFRPMVVDLKGLRAGRVTILRDHDPSQIVGQGTAKIDASSVTVAGQVTGDYTDKGDPSHGVVTHSRNGFVWAASVGVLPDSIEWVEAGRTAQANGKTFTGPCGIVRSGRLGEVSFVGIGADETASANIAATAANTGDQNMDEFKKWLQAMGLSHDTLSDDQRAKLQAKFDAEQTAGKGGDGGQKKDPPVNGSATPPPGDGGEGGHDPIQARRQQMAKDMRRVAAIDQLQAKYSGVKEVTLEDGKKQPVADFLATAIEAGTEPDAVELALLRASRAPTGGGTAMVNIGQGDLDAETITASMSLTAGMGEQFVAEQVPQARREQVMNAACSGRLRGFSLHALMDLVCASVGRPYFGNRKSDDFIRATLEAERMVRAAGGFSTLSLSGILSNLANKAMMASYDAQEVVWPYICAIRSHNDFKVHTRYRLDASGSFRKVGPDGELKHITMSDASFTNQLDTFGAMITLNRQMQINDDLSAFLEIPRFLGELSAVRKEEAVFVLLLSNPSSFFHADNRNLLSGAGSALSIASISAAEQKFMDQVNPNKKPILITPKLLLVGTALKVTAEDLYKEKLINESTAAKPAATSNPHGGKYKPYVSPFLNNTAIKDQDGKAITGQSATQWYLMASPSTRAAIAIAFLNGKRNPTIESADAEFQTLGMQWRAYDDFGVAMEEPVAAVKSNGQ